MNKVPPTSPECLITKKKNFIKNADLSTKEARLLFLRKFESEFFEKEKEEKENKMWWTTIYYQDGPNKVVQAESEKHAHILGQKAKDNNKGIVSFSVDFSSN